MNKKDVLYSPSVGCIRVVWARRVGMQEDPCRERWPNGL